MQLLQNRLPVFQPISFHARKSAKDHRSFFANFTKSAGSHQVRLYETGMSECIHPASLPEKDVLKVYVIHEMHIPPMRGIE